MHIKASGQSSMYDANLGDELSCDPIHVDPHYRHSSYNNLGCRISDLRHEIRCHMELIDAAIAKLRGRRLIFLGDSIMLQQWATTLFVMSPHINTLVCPRLRRLYDNHNHWSHGGGLRCANSTFPHFVPGKQGHMICYGKAAMMMPKIPSIDERLTSLITSGSVNQRDVIVLNAGLHYLNTPEALIKSLKLLGKLMKRPKLPHLYWRETSPQHFLTPKPFFAASGADLISFAGNGGTRLFGNECLPLHPGDAHGNKFNDLSNRFLQGVKLPILSIWESSSRDWANHVGGITNTMGQARVDCTHYCVPSVTVASWSFLLFTKLLRWPSEKATPCSTLLYKGTGDAPRSIVAEARIRDEQRQDSHGWVVDVKTHPGYERQWRSD